MWICLNNAFLSVVEAEKGGDWFKVRARKKAHLSKVFPGLRVHMSKQTDYRYRVFVRKDDFAEIMKKMVLAIDYGNFKDSVKDKKLKEMYSLWWSDHYKYQRALHSPIDESHYLKELP